MKRAAPRMHFAWVVLGGTAIALLATSGIRSAFGVFIKPMETEFGWDRTALSLVASLSFLFNGLSGPFVGRLADRWRRPDRHRVLGAFFSGSGFSARR